MNLRQSKNYADYLRKTGWIVEKIEEIYIFIRKLPLTPFSIIKIQRPQKIPDLKKIDQLAKKYRALSIFIEPVIHYPLLITRYKYKLSKSPFLPTKTSQLDLTPPEKKLFSQLSKKNRYCLKKASFKVLIQQNKTPEEIKKFYQAWRKTAGWKMLIPAFKNIMTLRNTFGQNALFLTAVVSKKIIAGTVILIVGKVAYYYYAFTSQEGRKLLAQYNLVWKAIKITKKKGCQVFDFEGIYDPRFPTKSWLGFSHFKKSFGGQEVSYPGCFKKNSIKFILS